MPDIFGRELEDYAHYQALAKQGILAHYQQKQQQQSGLLPHNFNSLEKRSRLFTQAATDAQVISFLTENLQAIHTFIDEEIYQKFRLDRWVPVVTDVPEGATSYAYRIRTRTGKGQLVDDTGRDLPTAAVGLRTVAYKLYTGGIAPTWTKQELRSGLLEGMALDTETLEAGIEGVMDHIEDVGLTGGDIPNAAGLINQPTSTTSSDDKILQMQVLNTLWTTGTPEELRSAVTDAINQLIATTRETVGTRIRQGLTVYTSVNVHNKLTSTPMGTDANKSIWEFIQFYNGWTQYTDTLPILEAVAELSTAATGDKERVIVGINDRRVMELAMPMQPRESQPIYQGFNVSVPIEYRFSALNIKRPHMLLYLDAVKTP